MIDTFLGIWVGRGDGAVGAELNVPSVRGDEVVWMCGGHAEVSGSLVAGRQIHPCQKPDGVPGKVKRRRISLISSAQ